MAAQLTSALFASLLSAAFAFAAEPTFTRAPPAGPYVGLRQSDFAQAQSFTSNDAVILTTYFYWYDSNAGESWVYEDGKTWFYQTIRDFWALVPPSRWAMIDGKPIIFLYAASFARAHDQSCVEFVRREFAKDFAGRTPYIVRGDGWSVETESAHSWGGAVGPRILKVAAIGPGYDHSAVPGRKPLIVDREDGQFYVRAWETLLRLRPATRPKIVHIETWNELHEATEICETKECGRKYIELTKRYGDIYRVGTRLPRRGPYADAKSVSCSFADGRQEGIKHLAEVGDGPSEMGERGGWRCLVAKRKPYGPADYLYFGIDDSFAFDEAEQPSSIEIAYFDSGRGMIELEYDSNDPKGSVADGAFKSGGQVQLQDTKTWKTHAFRLTDARFLNRTHGGDLRLAALGSELALTQVRVSRL